MKVDGANGADTEVSWPDNQVSNPASAVSEEESERKKVFENLKKLLVRATLEAETASSAVTRSLGQRYEARVRHLEELLRTVQRDRDEAREECLLLRKKLAIATSATSSAIAGVVAGPGHNVCVDDQQQPPQPQSLSQSQRRQRSPPQPQPQQQQQPQAQVQAQAQAQQPTPLMSIHPRSNLSGRRTRSLERSSSSLQLEIHCKKLSDLRQQSLQQQSKDLDRHSGDMEIIPSPDAQSSLTSSLHVDVGNTLEDQHSLISQQGIPGASCWDVPRMKMQQQQLQQLEPSDPHLRVHSSYDSSPTFPVPAFSSSAVPPHSGGDILGVSGLPGPGFVETASCSSLVRQRPVHLPEPPESDMQVMLNSLPERGKLLQAVMQAGPLLQTLMLAGPLPQWRHPPPAVAPVEIPKVPVAVPSGIEQSKGTASLSKSTSFGKSV